MSQEEIDAMLSGAGSVSAEPSQAQDVSIEHPEFGEIDVPSQISSATASTGIMSPLDPKLEMLYDLNLVVSIELGRTNMLIRDIMRLGRGSVVEFDKLVSEPVDVLVNGKKMAEGEVVVIDKHFGIRITSLVDPADRLRSLRK